MAVWFVVKDFRERRDTWGRYAQKLERKRI
jgi:hypothetical protein